LPAAIFRYPGSPHFYFSRLRLLGHLYDAFSTVIDDLIILLNECRRRDGALPPRTYQFPSRRILLFVDGRARRASPSRHSLRPLVIVSTMGFLCYGIHALVDVVADLFPGAVDSTDILVIFILWADVRLGRTRES
jgi:hypothetical protein